MSSPSTRFRTVVALLAGPALAWGIGAPSPASGQETVSGVAEACSAGNPDLESWCREVALGLRAARSGVGLLSAGGDELPGSASSVGWRLGSVPRFSVAGRFQLARIAHPDFRRPARVPAPERTSTIPAFHVNGAVGVFDGFSPLPTVGGVLAVDLLATGSLVLLPDSEGFDDATTAWGVGARLGLLRESFTLPGVTLSAARRWTGRVTLGSVDDGDAGEATLDVSTTSLRATVGKDVLGVGLLAGVGWDRYGGDAEIAVRDTRVADAPARTGSADVSDFVSSRALFYGGASLSFLVLQISAEGGWTTGYDAVAGRPGGGFDPGDATPFGGVSVRLIF